MQPASFHRWIRDHDFTISGLARELGLTRRTIYNYLEGKTRIPRTVELSLEALAARQRRKP